MWVSVYCAVVGNVFRILFDTILWMVAFMVTSNGFVYVYRYFYPNCPHEYIKHRHFYLNDILWYMHTRGLHSKLIITHNRTRKVITDVFVVNVLAHNQEGHSSDGGPAISLPKTQTDPRCWEQGNSFYSLSNHTLWQLPWEICHLISLLLLWALKRRQIMRSWVLLSIMSTPST